MKLLKISKTVGDTSFYTARISVTVAPLYRRTKVATQLWDRLLAHPYAVLFCTDDIIDKSSSQCYEKAWSADHHLLVCETGARNLD